MSATFILQRSFISKYNDTKIKNFTFEYFIPIKMKFNSKTTQQG